MNFLNSPSVKTGTISPHPPPSLLSCFGDLPWPSTGQIFQCRSVAVTHVMCWRGLRRKQRRQERVILVRSPVRVRVRPGVKGWACLAPNTDCTSSTNLCTKTPLVWGGGGWRGGGWRGSVFDSVDWEVSKLPLNSCAVRKDSCTGRIRGGVCEWGWVRSRLQILLWEDTAEANETTDTGDTLDDALSPPPVTLLDCHSITCE